VRQVGHASAEATGTIERMPSSVFESRRVPSKNNNTGGHLARSAHQELRI